MHTDIHYNDPDHDVNCANALRDMVEWLNEKQWAVLVHAALKGPETCNQIAFALNILAGVSGFPVHAFLETMRPTEYQAWYDSLPD